MEWTICKNFIFYSNEKDAVFSRNTFTHPYVFVYLSAYHLTVSAEKADGIAFEITTTTINQLRVKTNRDFNLAMMMDSTFIYFHDIECAGIIRCGFLRVVQ